ncbi:uncharacterized protein LOC108031015 isoform X2 [Drosophila biarmipes]|uniref:uncharacterized protein LOC108031015 isoform X2 n=1 Tax=Drosophila biarmipes TaxID=125945 RepID=UPI0021CC624F|nr:uncharacterized protein LOC108031015 isoform X2 [Drosophila biarmipes]
MDHIPIGMDNKSINTMDIIIEKATQSVSAKIDQFKDELKQSQNHLISTQGSPAGIMKEALKIGTDEYQNHSKKNKSNNILEDEEKGSIGDQKSEFHENEADIKKHRLREKYEEALKHDEKLEAEAKRSFDDPDTEMLELQTKLVFHFYRKKRHKDQVDVYKVVQEKLMASFKKDMDKLMRKFEVEYSRLSKAHSELMADPPMHPEKDFTDASSTHQP